MHVAETGNTAAADIRVQPVVLSGGSGTRLWPLSREKYPKQLLPLVGDDSLLQATVRRTDGIGTEVAPPMVVCNEEYRFVIAEQLRVMGKPGTVVLEPVGRNTAPALTLAALAAHGDAQADPVLLVMPADHVIVDTDAFQAAVRQGAALAHKGLVVTFGITPDAPETGYGYIQGGDALALDAGVHPTARLIARFVEKPDLKTAQSYLDQGSYLWNSGIFMMKASVWLSAIGQCRADILAACTRAWDGVARDGDFARVDKQAFSDGPADSIDYAVMERITTSSRDQAAADSGLPMGVVIPLQAGWSDVGAWDALWKVLSKDAQGNVAQGDVMLHDCHDSLALSDGRLFTCVGVRRPGRSWKPPMRFWSRTRTARRTSRRSSMPSSRAAGPKGKPIARCSGRGAGMTAWMPERAFRSSASWSNPVAHSPCRCTTTGPSTGSSSAARPR